MVELVPLVMSPNKTLAAQLYASSRLFPENAVEYFVSYYDYYQPEAYIRPGHLHREGLVDQRRDRQAPPLDHAPALTDVLVVASVSCIYGLGAPENYGDMHVYLETG